MTNSAPSQRWYSGITRQQWLVLTIASLGWVFDVFEGQIFVASMNEAMKSLLPPDTPEGRLSFYQNAALSSFLLGGALGGVLFGILADRIGRTKTMIVTILLYSLFTSVTALAQTWWQMVVLRFFVSLGVGGEWAVASALVAEVFPKHARAWSGAIFHSSSVLGTYLAIAAGTWIVGNPSFGWRWGFGIGALPALLTLWIRWQMKESDQWLASHNAEAQRRRPFDLWSGVADLFAPELIRTTILAVSLAVVGLATFWGVHIYGKDFLLHRAKQAVLSQANLSTGATDAASAQALKDHQSELKRSEMLGMFLVTTGGGLGLLMFGPICERMGRRRAFAVFHLGGFAMAVGLFQGCRSVSDTVLMAILPVFGFLTLGMHAGYAIYFPELFPTRMRGAGSGFCFNFARLIAAAVLIAKGWLQQQGLTFENAATVLSLLFLFGLVLLWFLPETKGTDLPD